MIPIFRFIQNFHFINIHYFFLFFLIKRDNFTLIFKSINFINEKLFPFLFNHLYENYHLFFHGFKGYW